MTGPVNVKKMATLNVKSGRSGKCEIKSTLNVKSGRSVKCGKIYAKCEKKVWSVAMTMQSDGKFGQFGRPGQFFSAFSGFGLSTFLKLKILGSVMILTESVKFYFKKKFVGGLGKLLGVLWGK